LKGEKVLSSDQIKFFVLLIISFRCIYSLFCWRNENSRLQKKTLHALYSSTWP